MTKGKIPRDHLFTWKAKDEREIYIYPRGLKYHVIVTDHKGGFWESPKLIDFEPLIKYLEDFHDANPQFIRMIYEHHKKVGG